MSTFAGGVTALDPSKYAGRSVSYSPAWSLRLGGMAYIEYGEPDRPMDHILKISTVHPEALRAHRRLYRVLVKRPSPLSRVRREMIAVAVSALNGCRY